MSIGLPDIHKMRDDIMALQGTVAALTTRIDQQSQRIVELIQRVTRCEQAIIELSLPAKDGFTVTGPDGERLDGVEGLLKALGHNVTVTDVPGPTPPPEQPRVLTEVFGRPGAPAESQYDAGVRHGRIEGAEEARLTREAFDQVWKMLVFANSLLEQAEDFMDVPGAVWQDNAGQVDKFIKQHPRSAG